MKVINNIYFKTLGVRKINDLNIDKPIVYAASSTMLSLQYCGGMQLIRKSTSIDSDMTEKLTLLNAKVSLGFFRGQYKNAHIYSRNAEYLDGRERVCYLHQEGDSLIISEFHGNRGAKYSSLFKELALRLQNSGFNCIDKKFKIERNELDKFINVVNELIDDRANDLLILEVPDKNDIDSIKIRNNTYYYFKAYWKKVSNKKSKLEVLLNDKEAVQKFIDVNKTIKNTADYIAFCDDLSKLNELKKKIDSINKLIDNRIESLKVINSLS